MKVLKNFIAREEGQDLVEYALLSGIVGVAGILVFPVIVDKMGTAYANWQTGAQNAWEPCAPAPAACP